MGNRKNPGMLEPQDRIFFFRFYEKYKHYIYFTAGKLASTPADCDDLVQETVIRILRNVATLKQLDNAKLAKYISVTVKTAYLDIRKSSEKDHLLFLDDAQLEEYLETAHMLGLSALEKLLVKQMPYAPPEDQIFMNWAVAQLRESLSHRDWLVLEAKYYLDFTQEEIGELIGVSPNSVRMVLHRARKKARSILERNAVGGDGYE